jgi:hypothetical protein
MIAIKSFRSIALSLLACAAACSAFTSCSKNNSSSGSNGGTFTATVSGTSFQSVIAGGEQVSSANLFFLAGEAVISGDTIELSITMQDSIALNTAIPFDGFITTLAYENLKTGTVYISESSSSTPGSVTITAYSSAAQQIGGTFSGTIYNQSNTGDSLVVTNGKFNVNYTLD